MILDRKSVGDFSSNGNIPIIAMLNYDVMLDRLTSTVKRGFPGMFSTVSFKQNFSWQNFSPPLNISRSALGGGGGSAS